MLTQVQQGFLDAAIAAAEKVHSDTGLLVSGQVAQAAMESAWGNRAPGCNYFGIKSHTCPYTAGTQTITTHENRNGRMVVENDQFASYSSMENSFRCHALLLLHNFPSAYSAHSSAIYIQALMKDPVSGKSYATDPNYEKLFDAIVAAHNLNKLDQ